MASGGSLPGSESQLQPLSGDGGPWASDPPVPQFPYLPMGLYPRDVERMKQVRMCHLYLVPGKGSRSDMLYRENSLEAQRSYHENAQPRGEMPEGDRCPALACHKGFLRTGGAGRRQGRRQLEGQKHSGVSLGLSLPSLQGLRLRSPRLHPPRPQRQEGSPRLYHHPSGPHHRAPRKLAPRKTRVFGDGTSLGPGAFPLQALPPHRACPWLTSAKRQARLWL